MMIKIDKDIENRISFPTHFSGGLNSTLSSATCIIIDSDNNEVILDTIIDYESLQYWYRYIPIVLSILDLSELTIGEGTYTIEGDGIIIGSGVLNIYSGSDKIEVNTIDYE